MQVVGGAWVQGGLSLGGAVGGQAREEGHEDAEGVEDLGIGRG